MLTKKYICKILFKIPDSAADEIIRKYFGGNFLAFSNDSYLRILLRSIRLVLQSNSNLNEDNIAVNLRYKEVDPYDIRLGELLTGHKNTRIVSLPDHHYHSTIDRVSIIFRFTVLSLLFMLLLKSADRKVMVSLVPSYIRARGFAKAIKKSKTLAILHFSYLPEAVFLQIFCKSKNKITYYSNSYGIEAKSHTLLSDVVICNPWQQSWYENKNVTNEVMLLHGSNYLKNKETLQAQTTTTSKQLLGVYLSGFWVRQPTFIHPDKFYSFLEAETNLLAVLLEAVEKSNFNNVRIFPHPIEYRTRSKEQVYDYYRKFGYSDVVGQEHKSSDSYGNISLGIGVSSSCLFERIELMLPTYFFRPTVEFDSPNQFENSSLNLIKLNSNSLSSNIQEKINNYEDCWADFASNTQIALKLHPLSPYRQFGI